MGIPVSALSRELMTELSREMIFPYDARFTGTYESGEDDDLEILAGDGPVLKKGNDMIKMRPSGKLSLRSPDDSLLLRFLENDQGSIYAVRYGSRIFRKN